MKWRYPGPMTDPYVPPGGGWIAAGLILLLIAIIVIALIAGRGDAGL